MKRLMYRIKNLPRQNSGETIVESIISLFVFTILMISVTTILNSALGMTSLAIEKNKTTQYKINDLVKGNGYDDEGIIRFSIGGIAVEHEVDIYDDSESMLIVFAPQG